MYGLLDLLLPGSGVSNVSIYTIGNNINNLGQITAYGTIGAQDYALILTPTPEPASAALLLAGGALLGLRAASEVVNAAYSQWGGASLASVRAPLVRV